MSKNRQVVLTEGPILKALIALALPIMATSFLNTFYSITDMAWIGMLGSRAVAGVGVGGMYVWLSQGLSALAKMGGQVNVAQALGRGRRDEAGQYACSAVQLTVIFMMMSPIRFSVTTTSNHSGFFTIHIVAASTWQ